MIRGLIMAKNKIQQKSFIFDLNKCTGCGACILACSIENEVALQNPWRFVHTFNEYNYPDIPRYHFSLACNHCVDPPCLKYCPALAYTKDEKTGAVLLNPDKCIGCKYCSWVCPYDAPKFNRTIGVMEKCTFCQHRLEEGFDPACVTLCPTTALQCGEYREKDQIKKTAGFPDADIKPAIRFVEKTTSPETSLTSGVDRQDLLSSFDPENPKIDLRTEWTLVVFTLLTALLVGRYSATIMKPGLELFLFFGLGIAAMGVSLFHLGKVFRAYRAIFNLKNSWLSREILFFTSFLLLALVQSYIFPTNQFLTWLALFLGLMSLISIDRVYRVLPAKVPFLHSASVVLSGFLFFSFFIGQKELFIIVVILKIVLYLVRKFPRLKKMQLNPFAFISRILIGFFFGLMFGTSELVRLQMVGFLCLLIGEIIDRCEYYLELKIVTPKREILEEVANSVHLLQKQS